MVLKDENRKMITQALSYRPVDRATPPGPRTGKGGLRPVDFVRLIDAERKRWPQLSVIDLVGVSGILTKTAWGSTVAQRVHKSMSRCTAMSCRVGPGSAGRLWLVDEAGTLLESDLGFLHQAIEECAGG